jgi:hypothetical protein
MREDAYPIGPYPSPLLDTVSYTLPGRASEMLFTTRHFVNIPDGDIFQRATNLLEVASSQKGKGGWSYRPPFFVIVSGPH